MVKSKKVIALVISGFTLLVSCNTKKEEKQTTTEKKQPNIILVMVDDLGYGDLGSYGQTEILTPNLDKLAKDGVRFTQFYTGSPVCAPARSVLLTGKHTGHTTVRANFGKGGVVGLSGKKGRIPLQKSDTTLADVLKSAGYVTAMTGKWGLGEPNTEGTPNQQGFDEWFGFLNQARAHDHYANYIWKNEEKYPLPGNDDGKKQTYTHDLFTDFALDYIDRTHKKENPFFLYIPYLTPHGDFEIPKIDSIYQKKDWEESHKVYAAMVSLIDRDMGKIVDKLKEHGISENTLVIFTSDNGPASTRENSINSNGKYRGKKRDLYEGGIRVPMIASMPGTIPKGKVAETKGYFADFMPTLSKFADTKAPRNNDGVSLKDILMGQEASETLVNRPIYWEFHEGGGKQAVLKGKWKAIRLNVNKKGFHDDIELYDIEADPSEEKNIAAEYPDKVIELKEVMAENHVQSEFFPFPFEN